MPTMPRPALVVIEAELVLGGLEAVFDRPSMAFDGDQRFNRCARRAPGGEEGEVAVGNATPDQQAACPQAVTCIVEWLALEIGQFEITPIMQPQFLGSGSCRQVLPVGRAPRPGDVSCRARGRRRRSRVSRGSWQQPTAWVGYQEGEHVQPRYAARCPSSRASDTRSPSRASETITHVAIKKRYERRIGPRRRARYERRSQCVSLYLPRSIGGSRDHDPQLRCLAQPT